jgi:DNA mismatch endonuclease (patch repair protein)
VVSSDVFTPEKRSQVMAKVRGKHTGPEKAVRRLLWRAGYRYRLHGAALPGKPDLVFVGRRTALFVHGCFWHGHDCARGAREPKANAEYWRGKIARNRARDAKVAAELAAAGWTPLTVWECELRDEPALLARLTAALDQATSARSRAGGRPAQASATAR